MKLKRRLNIPENVLVASSTPLRHARFHYWTPAEHLEYAERGFLFDWVQTHRRAAMYLYLWSKVVSLLRYTLIPGFGGRISARKRRSATRGRGYRAPGEMLPGRGGSGAGLPGILAGLGGSDTGLRGKCYRASEEICAQIYLQIGGFWKNG